MKTWLFFTMFLLIFSSITVSNNASADCNRRCTRAYNKCFTDAETKTSTEETLKTRNNCYKPEFTTCTAKCTINGSCVDKCKHTMSNLDDLCVGELKEQEIAEYKALTEAKKADANAKDPNDYKRLTTQTCQDQYNDTKCVLSTCNSIEPDARNKLTECNSKATATEKTCQTDLKNSTLGSKDNCKDACNESTDAYLEQRKKDKELEPLQKMPLKITDNPPPELTTKEIKPLPQVEQPKPKTLTTTQQSKTTKSSGGSNNPSGAGNSSGYGSTSSPAPYMNNNTSDPWQEHIKQMQNQAKEEREKKAIEQQKQLERQKRAQQQYDQEKWYEQLADNLNGMWSAAKAMFGR